jgi:hypothetical protein
MTSKIKKACGNPDCGTSTGICDRITFGSGELDSYGYWEHPCRPCAEAWEASHPGAACWPNEHHTPPEGPLFERKSLSALLAANSLRAWLGQMSTGFSQLLVSGKLVVGHGTANSIIVYLFDGAFEKELRSLLPEEWAGMKTRVRVSEPPIAGPAYE